MSLGKLPVRLHYALQRANDWARPAASSGPADRAAIAKPVHDAHWRGNVAIVY